MKLEDSKSFREMCEEVLTRVVLFIKCGKVSKRNIQGQQRTIAAWEDFSVTVAERVGFLARKARSYWLTTFLDDKGVYQMGGLDRRGCKNLMVLDRITAVEREARHLLRLSPKQAEDELNRLAASNDRRMPDVNAVKRELKLLRDRKYVNVPDKFRDLLSDDNKPEVPMPVLDLADIMPKLIIISERLTSYDQRALAPQVLALLRKGEACTVDGASGFAVPHANGEGEFEFCGGRDGLPEDTNFDNIDLSSIESMLLTVDPRVIKKVSLACWQLVSEQGAVPVDMVPASDRIAYKGRTYFDVTNIMAACEAQGHAGFLLVQWDKRENLVFNQGEAAVLDLSTSLDRIEADKALQASEDEWHNNRKRSAKVELPVKAKQAPALTKAVEVHEPVTPEVVVVDGPPADEVKAELQGEAV